MTAGGKNVAPAVLEDRLRAHPLVSQCMVVGDGQPFIAALVTLDPEALAGLGRARTARPATLADLVDDPDLRAEIQARGRRGQQGGLARPSRSASSRSCPTTGPRRAASSRRASSSSATSSCASTRTRSSRAVPGR